MSGQYKFSIPSLSLEIICELPTEIFAISEVLLCGWRIAHSSQVDPDIVITKTNKYHLYSKFEGLVGSHSDLISIFNLFINSLALHIAHFDRCFSLHHAGGIIDEKGSCIIVVGDRKSGKSTYVTQQTMKSGSCIADDLILLKENTVVSIGLPVRLRRPVLTVFIDNLGSNNMLTGDSLVFLKPSSVNLVEAGRLYPIQEIRLLKEHEIELQDKLSLEHLRERRIGLANNK